MGALERSLFQFVALALPAVAILLQVMISFQEKYSNIESEIAFRREFRIIEFSLFFLVAAGGVLSLSLFQSADSETTRFGISLLFISLAALGFGTWLTFGRARYPTKFFESPEEMLASALVVSTPIITISILLYLFRRQWINFVSLDTQLLAFSIIAVNVLIVSYYIVKYYKSQKQIKKEINEWKEILSTFENGIEDLRERSIDEEDEEPMRSPEEYKRRSENLKNLLTQIEQQTPQPLQSEEISNSFSQIERAISQIPKTTNELIKLKQSLERKSEQKREKEEELEENKQRLEEINVRVEEIDDELPEGAFSDFKEPYVSDFKADTLAAERRELREERTDIKRKIRNLEETLDELESSINNIKSDIEINRENIRQSTSTIHSELQDIIDKSNEKRTFVQ